MAETRPILWVPAALRDLERIFEYQAEPAAQAGFCDQLFGVIGRLSAAPYLGRAGRWPGTRELRAAPGYTLAYRAREGRVEIVAVLPENAAAA